MWKTFSLTSLVVSIILVCLVNQSHGFDLEEWIPSTESIKEALTDEADCIEVFDDSSESSSISCTPKNSKQGVEQTQQPKALKFLETKYDCVEVFDDSLESSSISCTPKNSKQGVEQTQQQAQKTLPRIPINCKEQEHIWNGKLNHELKKREHNYLIDHDEKRLLSIGETLPWRKWRKVLEFSDHLIRVERANKKKTRVDTLTINRVTGKFDEQRVISNERALKSFGKPGVLKVSGSCEKIEATPKF